MLNIQRFLSFFKNNPALDIFVLPFSPFNHVIKLGNISILTQRKFYLCFVSFVFYFETHFYIWFIMKETFKLVCLIYCIQICSIKVHTFTYKCFTFVTYNSIIPRFLYSFVDGCVDCFKDITIMNCATVNIDDIAVI